MPKRKVRGTAEPAPRPAPPAVVWEGGGWAGLRASPLPSPFRAPPTPAFLRGGNGRAASAAAGGWGGRRDRYRPRAPGLTAGRGGARRGPVGAGCFWREGGMRGEGVARPCPRTRGKGGKRPRSLSPRAAAALPPKPPPVGGRGASPKGPP